MNGHVWGTKSQLFLYFLAHSKKQIYILQGGIQICLFISGSVDQVVVFLSTYREEVSQFIFGFLLLKIWAYV